MVTTTRTRTRKRSQRPASTTEDRSNGGSKTSRFDADRHGLAATFVWESGDGAKPYDAVVRVSGRRVDVVGRRTREDEFVKDEHIRGIVPGSGPVSVTTNVDGINAGEWSVTAELLRAPGGKRHTGRTTAPKRDAGRERLPPAAWSWRRWAARPAPATAICTRWAPLTRLDSAPAVLPGSYFGFIAAGILLALAVQAHLVSARGINNAHVLTGSLLAVAAGALGAKLWYRVDRAGRDRASGAAGWCIQGFLAGAALGLAASVWAFDLPVGTVLDATTPAMFLGLAVGRLGCFFTGCCAGRPSASRWAVWSSDRRIGARRIPTQPLESLAAGAIGAIAWQVYSTAPGIGRGALLVAGLAAYTLARQLLLRLRALPRRSSRRVLLTAATAVVALIGAAAVLAA